MKESRGIKVLFAIVLFMLCFSLSGCSLFFDENGNDISSVRYRVKKMQYEMAESLISGFKEKNAKTIKELFCPKSKELPTIEEQIEETFSFVEGEILSYTIAKTHNEKGYANSYGVVSKYRYSGQIEIYTDSQKEYTLIFNMKYLFDKPIEGMTSYVIEKKEAELDSFIFCRAGYDWYSPYDGEAGMISAELIQAIGTKDLSAVKSLMWSKTLENPELDHKIQTAFELFEGTPVFTKREDGLYNKNPEEGFLMRVFSHGREKDENGNDLGFWVSVGIYGIKTTTGKRYNLEFSMCLKDETSKIFQGISYFELADGKTDDPLIIVGYE